MSPKDDRRNTIKLSRRAIVLRNELDQNGGWMTRADLAATTGKKRIMPHDVNLLEQMVDNLILEKRVQPTKKPGLPTYEYRFLSPDRSEPKGKQTFYVIYINRPGRPLFIEHETVEIFTEYRDKKPNPPYHHHELNWISDDGFSEVNTLIVNTEKRINIEDGKTVQRRINDYLIEKRLIAL